MTEPNELNEGNKLVLGIMRDAQRIGVDLASQEPDVIAPDVAFLVHKQVAIRDNTEKKTEAIKRHNASRSAASRAKISNSVSEAEQKHHQEALQKAAKAIEHEEQREATKPKRSTSKRNTSKAKTPSVELEDVDTTEQE